MELEAREPQGWKGLDSGTVLDWRVVLGLVGSCALWSARTEGKASTLRTQEDSRSHLPLTILGVPLGTLPFYPVA